MYKKRAHDFICSAPSLNSIPLIQLKSSVYKNKYRRIVVEIRELSNSIREISFFSFPFPCVVGSHNSKQEMPTPLGLASGF